MRNKFSQIAFALLLAISAAVGFASVFVGGSPLDTEGISSHISHRMESRMDRLDSYAEKLMDMPSDEGDWPDLKSFPDDMVLYRYVCDTLHSWYNRFSVNNDNIGVQTLYHRLSNPRVSLSSPLAMASETPMYMNFGSRWYVVKMRSKGEVKVIEGLLVKDSMAENIAEGENGINKYIHIHGKYDVASLTEAEGSSVSLDGKPVFKVVEAKGALNSGPVVMSYALRWIAMACFLAALLLFLAFHRSIQCCVFTIASIVLLSLIARSWGQALMEYSRLFSPILYANDSFMNSFGVLLIVNIAVSLSAFCVWLCRDSIRYAASLRPVVGTALSSFFLLAAALDVAYAFYMVSSLILNSGIAVELYRLHNLSWYTFAVYLSYALLLSAAFLNLELFLRTSASHRVRGLSILTVAGMLCFAALGAGSMGLIVARLGFRKEEYRVKGWSNRLALDRDLEMEMDLRRMEGDIAQDPIIQALCFVNGGDKLIARRLEDMYFGRICRDYDLFLTMLDGSDPVALGERLSTTVPDGSQIGPMSYFQYSYSAFSGSEYTGVFDYHSSPGGLVCMVVELMPKPENSFFASYSPSMRRKSSAVLPPMYYYAKYNDNKLVSFTGNFAYPTVLGGVFTGTKAKRGTVSVGGYRHFINTLSDEETIVVSRRERNWQAYFVSFSSLFLLLVLAMLPFVPRKRKDDGNSHFFSTRIRRMLVASLSVTLVAMAIVSVLFVYQRNDFNVRNMLSRKISSVQIMLDGVCRGMNDCSEMKTHEFVRAFERIGKQTNSVITLYTPDGQAFMCNATDVIGNLPSGTRVSGDAYHSIRFDNQRYYIGREKFADRPFFMLYAPVLGASGNIIAIAATPYTERDYDFLVDAVFHSATIICMFLILLFVTILLSTSVTNSIFRPLLSISRKMQDIEGGNLEFLNYEGDDEISSLVGAYNKMVVDLRESTSKLAVAERDKAWSQMARQVAHEIKNPLTPIKLEIQRLQRLKQKNSPLWEEKFDEVSAVVLEHIDILTQTANDFSTFAKLYNEPPVEIDLDKVLKEQVMLFSDKGVQITYLGTDGAVIMGPKPQLIRAFVNLLTNAVQALDGVENPQIVVSLRKGGAEGTWEVVFEDNGPGVPAENLDKLFTPNFTTKSSGTGLGLAICHSIVDKCGGRISYSRSFTLGGAAFTIVLPSNVQNIQSSNN